MIRRLISISLLCVLVTSCGWNNFRRSLGVGTEAPDEFLVEPKKDLTIPRDFSLPEPGSIKAHRVSQTQQAETIVFGDYKEVSGNEGRLERSFTEEASLDDVDDNIRDVVEKDFEEEKSIFGTEKGSTLESVLDPFGYNRAKPKIVHGEKENQRIREALSKDEKVSDEDVIIVEDW